MEHMVSYGSEINLNYDCLTTLIFDLKQYEILLTRVERVYDVSWS